MKNFLMFAGDNYYPSGGWNDFVSDYETIDEAAAAANEEIKNCDWAHVIDLGSRNIVRCWLKSRGGEVKF